MTSYQPCLACVPRPSMYMANAAHRMRPLREFIVNQPNLIIFNARALAPSIFGYAYRRSAIRGDASSFTRLAATPLPGIRTIAMVADRTASNDLGRSYMYYNKCIAHIDCNTVALQRQVNVALHTMVEGRLPSGNTLAFDAIAWPKFNSRTVQHCRI